MPVCECFHGISVEVHAVRESSLLTLQHDGNVTGALYEFLDVFIVGNLLEGPNHLQEGVRSHLTHHTGLDKLILCDSDRVLQKFRVAVDVDPHVKLRDALIEA